MDRIQPSRHRPLAPFRSVTNSTQSAVANHRWLAPFRSLSTVHSVLRFGDILNDAFQTVLAINDFAIATSRPDSLVRDRIRILAKNSRRVGFELIPDEFRFLVRCHREVHMIGSGIHRMQMPATNSGVFATNGFDLVTLNIVQDDRTLGHSISTPRLQQRLRRLVPCFPLSPPARIPWQPCSVSRPGDEVGDEIIHLTFPK